MYSVLFLVHIQILVIIQQDIFAGGRENCSLGILLEVADHQQIFLSFSVISHQVVLVFQIRNDSSVYQSFFIIRIFPESDQLFIEGKDRVRIFFLSFYINRSIVWIYHKPWSAFCKSGVFFAGPLNGSSGVVSAVDGDHL